ncbi:Molybdopterin molybdenumtransferase [BD1-7 clade bacterium]|uniref:Molybdopterin molybdenumtransferase n=1 Tax=BD1-7 clade bacterium TaxID=2029982 RepID=A0A5S9PD50_9GAMM|nr:Molybdopterin molybdenumtransferase [BD1-7 clade bacterium]
MLSFDQALSALLRQASEFRPDTVVFPLAESAGCILAEDIAAQCDVPPQDNSAMDGFAFRCADISAQDTSALPVSQKVFAGSAPAPLKPGTAVRLFTGSVIPEGADTVELQENCTYDDEVVQFHQSVTYGQHVRCAGEDIQQGRVLAEIGQTISSRLIGILASTGVAEVCVFKPLKLGLLATGDELIEPGKPLASGQIYNSNLYMLQAELQASGYQVQAAHVSDNLEVLTQTLTMMIQECDLIMTIGGVSVGDADLVKTAITALGSLDLWKVAMKPGKPLSFGRLRRFPEAPGRDVPVIGLPGNPVSAFATCRLFAMPFLQVMQGGEMPAADNETYPIQLSQSLHPKREEFVRVQRQREGDRWVLVPFSHQGSGVLSSVLWSSGFARIPMQHTTNSGDRVEYIPF